MDDVGGGGAKVRSKPHVCQRTDSSRRLASSAGGSIRAVGHRRESPGISGCKNGDSKSAQGKEISANYRWTIRVADKIRDIEQVVIMSKHCEKYDSLLVWQYRILPPRRGQPVVKPTRANDGGVFRQ